MELSNALASHFALPLSPTFVFDYPTPAAMVEQIIGRPATGPMMTVHPAPPQPTTNKLAVLAISHQAFCTAPGDALPHGDAIGAVPHQRYLRFVFIHASFETTSCRWDRDAQDASSLGFGAFMDGVANFDAALFGLGAMEATHIDPQHRSLLHHAATCLHRAGHRAGQRQDVGVYVGISWTEYSRITEQAGLAMGAYSAQSAVLSVAAGRISFHLGLRYRVQTATTLSTALESSQRPVGCD